MHIPDRKDDVVESLFQALLGRERISTGLVQAMASWKHSGFSAFGEPDPASHCGPGLARMLRYIKKPSVALIRIRFSQEEQKVTYHAGFNPCSEPTG